MRSTVPSTSPSTMRVRPEFLQEGERVIDLLLSDNPNAPWEGYLAFKQFGESVLVCNDAEFQAWVDMLITRLPGFPLPVRHR